MSRLTHRIRRIPGPERAVWLLLLVGALTAGGIVAFARSENEPDQSVTVSTAQATADSSGASSGGQIPRCADADIPARPRAPITCRTSKSVLTIVGQGKPVILGDTQVRVLEASVAGGTMTVTTRLRLRNETESEQGVQAGGQELYLNLAGKRIDSKTASAVRVEPKSGKTVRLRFALTENQLATLRKEQGNAELGVKPWNEGAGDGGSTVGVIRLRVGLPDEPQPDEGAATTAETAPES